MSRLARLQRHAAAATHSTGVTIKAGPSDHRVRTFGRWWRKWGYYDVWVPGTIYRGPMRYRRARRYIAELDR